MKTKYQKIVDDIRKRIFNGEYKGGYRLPGQFELAAQYQVSAITANRALNELRELGLIERRERSGSYVLSSPRLLSRIYILLSGKYENEIESLMPYWQEITELARKKGITTQLISMTDPDFSRKVLAPERDGFGVLFLRFQDRKIINEFEKNATPYVVLGIKSDAVKYNATEDRRGAARELTRKLIERGSTSIAFFGTRSFSNHYEVELGIADAVSEALSKVKLKAYNATEESISMKVSSVVMCDDSPDCIIVMGGMMPFLALPTIMNTGKSLLIGFMTENQTVLQLKEYALIASYSQQEAAKLAFYMLMEVTAGKLPGKATRLTEFKIVN